MPYTEPTPLGGTTLARKWKLQVDTSVLQDGSSWVPVRGITDSTPTGAPGLQADSDYDAGGATSSTATTQEWGFTATFKRAVVRGTSTYDPGQEFLRLMSDRMGVENSAHVRWFEWNGPTGPKVEAYEGYAVVAYSNNGGGPDALSTAGVTLTGQGMKLPITHPDATGAPAPTVTSIAPNTGVPAAGGMLLAVTGTQLNTVTLVQVGGTTVPVADWDSFGSTGLSLKAPAKAAGQYDLIVTNPGGQSGTSVATKITYV